MAGFEDLIRGALVKQGNTTPESREKIYDSARQALDRMVTDNASLEPDVVKVQRAKLEDAISRIEADQSDALAAAEAVETKPEPETAAEPKAEIAEPDEKPESVVSLATEEEASKPEQAPDPVLPVPDAEEPSPVSEPARISEPPEAPVEEIVEAVEEKPTPMSVKPAIDEGANTEPVDQPVPKIELSSPSEQDEKAPELPETSETEIDVKPFSLEPDPVLAAPPEESPPPAPFPDVAPVVVSTAVTAAAANLDLTKGTRVAPDIKPEPVSPQTAPAPVTTRVEPSIEVPTTAARPVEPSVTDVATEAPQPVRLQSETETPEIYAQSYTGNALNERKPYAKMLLWTIILVGLGVAIWWAVTFGPALIKAQLDGSVPNPRATLESGSFIPGDGNENGWVTVFVPDANEDDVIPGTRSNAEIQRENGRQVMRMASPDNSPDNNLKIRIARSVMESLRGKAATFELVIRSTASESQEFVLFCEFSKMGNCGRKRFSAGSNSEPFIFDVLVNDVALPANEDAYLSLNTDFSGKGRALDLFSVRVRTGA